MGLVPTLGLGRTCLPSGALAWAQLTLPGLHAGSRTAGWPKEWVAARLRVTRVALGEGLWALARNLGVTPI